jgi:hypothetical protein
VTRFADSRSAGRNGRAPARRSRSVPTPLNLRELRPPDGLTLRRSKSSFLNTIYKYLSDATTTQDRAFAFDGLDFDDATIRIRPEIETAVTKDLFRL